MNWNRDTAITTLRQHAAPKSLGLCAQYTRTAIEAGGLTIARPSSHWAKDYGIGLMAAGFLPMTPDSGNYWKGDVVIINGFAGHPEGHMAMFDGDKWISDFVQRSLYPGPAYRASRPLYTIYRYPLVVDGLNAGASSNLA